MNNIFKALMMAGGSGNSGQIVIPNTIIQTSVYTTKAGASFLVNGVLIVAGSSNNLVNNFKLTAVNIADLNIISTINLAVPTNNVYPFGASVPGATYGALALENRYMYYIDENMDVVKSNTSINLGTTQDYNVFGIPDNKVGLCGRYGDPSKTGFYDSNMSQLGLVSLPTPNSFAQCGMSNGKACMLNSCTSTGNTIAFNTLSTDGSPGYTQVNTGVSLLSTASDYTDVCELANGNLFFCNKYTNTTTIRVAIISPTGGLIRQADITTNTMSNEPLRCEPLSNGTVCMAESTAGFFVINEELDIITNTSISDSSHYNMHLNVLDNDNVIMTWGYNEMSYATLIR